MSNTGASGGVGCLDVQARLGSTCEVVAMSAEYVAGVWLPLAVEKNDGMPAVRCVALAKWRGVPEPEVNGRLTPPWTRWPATTEIGRGPCCLVRNCSSDKDTSGEVASLLVPTGKKECAAATATLGEVCIPER